MPRGRATIASMSTISLQDLQRDPAGLLDRVEAGEHLVVSREGRPVAELRPIDVQEEHAVGPRGACRRRLAVDCGLLRCVPVSARTIAVMHSDNARCQADGQSAGVIHSASGINQAALSRGFARARGTSRRTR